MARTQALGKKPVKGVLGKKKETPAASYAYGTCGAKPPMRPESASDYLQ
jgi:hypothetical protein